MNKTEKVAQEIADNLQGIIEDGYFDAAAYGSGVIQISQAEYNKLKKLVETYVTPQKRYREKNKEYYREYHRKWQQDNKERVSQYQKAWRQAKKTIDNKTNDGIVNNTQGE